MPARNRLFLVLALSSLTTLNGCTPDTDYKESEPARPVPFYIDTTPRKAISDWHTPMPGSPGSGIPLPKAVLDLRAHQNQKRRELSDVHAAKNHIRAQNLKLVEKNANVAKAAKALAEISSKESQFLDSLLRNTPEGKSLLAQRDALQEELKTYARKWDNFDYKTKRITPEARRRKQAQLTEQLQEVESKITSLRGGIPPATWKADFDRARDLASRSFNRAADDAIAAFEPQMASLLKRESKLQKEIEAFSLLMNKALSAAPPPQATFALTPRA